MKNFTQFKAAAIHAVGPEHNGTWYGRVGGFGVTPACTSKAQALAQAEEAVLSGKYAAKLTAEIASLERLTTPEDVNEALFKALQSERIPRLRELLAEATAS